MSLLDSVLGAASGLGGKAGQGPLIGHLLELVSSKDFGGLPGLVQKFKDNGMGNLVSSWIGDGENLPVQPAQIERVLGAPQVQQLAAKSGIAPADILIQVAQLLPDVINKLSAGGSLPTGDMLEQGIGLLKGRFLS